MHADTEKRTIILKGIGASPGIAIGTVSLFDRFDSSVSFHKLRDASLVPEEIERFRAALKESEKQLLEIKSKLTKLAGEDPLYIIDVHIMILKDKRFINYTIRNIKEMCINAEWAIKITIDRYKEIFEKVDDEYLSGRISDIRYVGQMILRNIVGERPDTIAEAGDKGIIVAIDLSPADTARMMINKVMGFATDMGGKTSHTAIVARAAGIPAVVALEKITQTVHTNDTLIIDGSAGVVVVNPDPEMLRRYKNNKKNYEAAEKHFLQYAKLPAETQDHYKIEIGGNIEFIEEIPSAIDHGADGIGLYRTEFIYINKEQLPTEDEHYSHYRQVVGIEGLGWATIRTFDLGGDKFHSDLKLAREMNPQMGLRAIRFCLKEIDLFKIQLRAIARASAHGKTRIMFPMISGLEEIQKAKQIFYEVKEDLLHSGIPVGDDIEIGIMIEVPSAVIIADELAKEVDFFSIGTNDLIQYALAIDRINERVSYLYEPLHPAVLRLIKQVVDVGHRAGIRVAMCGEMAGEPAYVMILLGLEIDELSMNPLAIPRVKKIIRASTLKESRQLLGKIMTFSSAVEIREFVRRYMRKRFPEEFPINDN